MSLLRLLLPPWLLLLSALSGLSLVAGCAAGGARPSVGANSSSSRGDIATASDESDARKRARIRFELASTYYTQGQYNTSLDELKQALAIDPTLPSAHELRALIYDAIGETERAERSFKDALSLDERDGSVLHNYGWHLCQLRQYAAADALFERAAKLPITPLTSKTLLARGVCQISAGLYPEAEKNLSRSYELDPSSPATAYNLSAVLYRRGELERARFYIRRVNNLQAQTTAESLWLAIRVENKLNNPNGRDELASQLRSRFPGARETTALELGRFDE